MNTNLKLAVLLFLQTQELDKYDQFNKAFELYKQSEGKSHSMEIKLNRAGFSEDGLKHLLYDLQKLHGITDSEVASAPVVEKVIDFNELIDSLLQKLPIAYKKAMQSIFDKFLEVVASLDFEKLKSFNTEVLETKEETLKAREKAVAKKVTSPATIANIDLKVVIFDNLLNALQPLLVEKMEVNEEEVNNTLVLNKEAIQTIINATETPEGAAEGHKYVEGTEFMPMREEFPFLDDPNCPETLLVVVGKKITAHRNYLKKHAQLQEIESGAVEVSTEEQQQIAFEAQEAFAENRACYDELNHYKATGEILGKHPSFKQTVAKREVDNMKLDELAKYRTSSATFISKKRTELKNAEITPEKKAELEEAIADREYKLNLVNIRLGVNGSK